MPFPKKDNLNTTRNGISISDHARRRDDQVLDDDDLLLCTEEDPVMIHDLEEGEAELEN